METVKLLACSTRAMSRLPLLRARGLRRADRSFRDVNGTPTSEEPTFRDVGVPCHVVQSYSSRTVRSLDIPGLGIRLVVWRPKLHYAQTRVLAGLEAALNVDVPLRKDTAPAGASGFQAVARCLATAFSQGLGIPETRRSTSLQRTRCAFNFRVLSRPLLLHGRCTTCRGTRRRGGAVAVVLISPPSKSSCIRLYAPFVRRLQLIYM